MKSYEIACIIKPDLEEEALSQVTEGFSELVAKNGGELLGIDNWGKRKMAYEILKYKEGIYVFIRAKMDEVKIHEVDRVIKLSENVLRNLVIKLN